MTPHLPERKVHAAPMIDPAVHSLTTGGTTEPFVERHGRVGRRDDDALSASLRLRGEHDPAARGPVETTQSSALVNVVNGVTEEVVTSRSQSHRRPVVHGGWGETIGCPAS